MNLREGMRRLGILLGVSGGILGGCLAYSDARATWDNHTAHRKFESLMASPTMQKVAEAARDYQKEAWAKYQGTPTQPAASPKDPWEEAAKQYKAGQTRQATIGSKFGGIPVESDRETTSQSTTHGPWEKYKASSQDTSAWRPVPEDKGEEPSGFPVLVSLDGIKQVTVDKVGVVSSIELSMGESVQRVDPPALKAYVVPLLYPILGFLLPWGGIRVLTWVGSGFVERRP